MRDEHATAEGETRELLAVYVRLLGMALAESPSGSDAFKQAKARG